MGPYNKFAVLGRIKGNVDYALEGSKNYNYIKISDDVLNEWVLKLMEIPTFWHRVSRPNKGLARYGVTLIPPESLPKFYDVVKKDENLNEVKELMVMIKKAIKENKYIIHFGI